MALCSKAEHSPVSDPGSAPRLLQIWSSRFSRNSIEWNCLGRAKGGLDISTQNLWTVCDYWAYRDATKTGKHRNILKDLKITRCAEEAIREIIAIE